MLTYFATAELYLLVLRVAKYYKISTYLLFGKVWDLYQDANDLLSPLLPSTCSLSCFLVRFIYVSLLPNNQLLLYALPQSPLSLIPDPSAPAPPPSLLSGSAVCVSERAGSQWYYYSLLLVTPLPTSDEVNHMDSFAAGFSERVWRVNELSCFPFRGEGEIE